MSFFHINTSKNNKSAPYVGAIFKRPKPVERDYKVLFPGESISCTIDLGSYYKFAESSDDDVYEIMYSVSNIQLSTPGNGDAKGGNNGVGRQLESLVSNTLTLQIHARDPPKPPSRRILQGNRSLRGLQTVTGSTAFNGCDATEQSLLHQARAHALTASIEALEHLTGVGTGQSSAACPRYEEWFNNYDANRHSELESGYKLIRDRMEDAGVTFDCTCNG